jgi:hypothetical protein
VVGKLLLLQLIQRLQNSDQTIQMSHAFHRRQCPESDHVPQMLGLRTAAFHEYVGGLRQ